MRLFAAIEPTPEFREALSDMQEQLRAAGVGGRYLSPMNLHLTLAFVGEWPVDITPVLPSVTEPFHIALSGPGLFPEAKVLWAGVEPSPQLHALAALVRGRLDDLEIPYDRQAFNPHITLIRKPVLPGGVLPPVEPMHAQMTVREVCLYESVHEADGMRYTVIGRSKGEAC